MKRVLAVAAAAAALMALVPMSFAAETMQGDYYVIDAQGGTKLVVGKAHPRGLPLLLMQGGAKPANCAPGSFYQAGDGGVAACETDAMYDMGPPPTGQITATGEAYPPGAMVLMPRQ